MRTVSPSGRPPDGCAGNQQSDGELIELEYDSFEDFALQYDEVTQQIAALERAKKKMADELKLMMGDERELPLANGWHFAKYASTRKSYPVALVMELLEDDATRFLKVEKTKLDAERKEHAEDGGRWPEIGRRLREGLEVESSTESLRLVKSEATQ
jgi:hypothetical protein